MPPLRVLYDGWALARRPNSPNALHLLALLAALPEEVEAHIAFPEDPPAWVPQGVSAHVEAMPNSGRGRLIWELRVLPRLYRGLGVDLLHLTSPYAPLFGELSILVSPTGYGSAGPRSKGVYARLRAALGHGGMTRAAALLWPDDLPTGDDALAYRELPPVVHSDFTPTQHLHSPEIPGLELPETYVLFHGSGDERTLTALLTSWTWAAGSLGEYYPLYLLGLDAGARSYAKKRLQEFELVDSVRVLPKLPPQHIAPLYQGCSALYHLGPVSPWGGAIRHGLACARPVVAEESPQVDNLAGPAAFLVAPGDPRALGAAMISVVINAEVYEPLMEAAHERAKAWREPVFGERLLAIYQSLL